MRATSFLFIAVMLAVPAQAQRQSLGIFGTWGAFRDGGGTRCYAIAEANRRLGAPGVRAFASVGYWPFRRAKGQLHFRLSRPKRAESAILLRIDQRTFQLVGNGADAWAPDARADADIVAAMRTGLAMTLDTRSERGVHVRDHYPLRGAATAIDAAALACAG